MCVCVLRISLLHYTVTGVQNVTLTLKAITMVTVNQKASVSKALSYTSCVQVLSSGHIGIAVPDVYKACERFESLGVNFVKKPDGGEWS